MEKIILKNSSLSVSRLCFGGFSLGEYDCGFFDKNEQIKSLKNAIDYGINFIDTADIYGKG